MKRKWDGRGKEKVITGGREAMEAREAREARKEMRY